MTGWAAFVEAGVTVETVLIGSADMGAIWPEEAHQIARALPKRQREFAAGRIAAKRAMARLGFAASPLLSGHDRVPVWPDGIVGSISHTTHLCLAALAKRDDGFAAIGVDLEDEIALPEADIEMVCRREEIAWLDAQPAERRGVLAMAIFQLKRLPSNASSCSHGSCSSSMLSSSGWIWVQAGLTLSSRSLQTRLLRVTCLRDGSCLSTTMLPVWSSVATRN